jgi:predicted nucleic acid-binding protein
LAISGLFQILDMDSTDLRAALDIRLKYRDSGMSLVDAISLAACERYRISRVFTFDRVHFSIYRPRFTDALELVPEL